MENLFKSFDPVSKSKWKQKIEQDLKGAQYEESVVWQSELGSVVQPFYHQEDLVNKSISHFAFKRNKPCILGQYFKWFGNAIELNQKILTALQFNVSSLTIDLSNEPVSTNQLHDVFNQVQTDLLDVTFVNVSEESSFLKVLSEYQFKANTGCWTLDSAKQSEFYNQDWRNVLIDVSAIGNDSASIVFELAAALSRGADFLEQSEINKGQLQFNFVVAGNYFFEIAKLRAFRFLWKLITEEYGLKSRSCYIQSELAQYNKSNSDENLNILRATTEAMSAVIGGCDSMVLNGESSVGRDSNTLRTYNNVFNILKFESNILNADDAASGSFYIESLTEQIAKAAWKQFQEIQDAGGYEVFSKTERFQKVLSEGKTKSAEKLHEIEKVRNLYQN